MNLLLVKKAVTMKDIASALDISPATVHNAIYNKKGVGKDTKNRVLQYLKDNDFELNRAASALKRRPIHLVSAFIDNKGSNRYFYGDIITGMHKAYTELKAFNVKLTEYYFQPTWEEQYITLEKVLKEYGNDMDGLVTNMTDSTKLNPVIKRFTDKGIAVVTVVNDAPESTRNACIVCDDFAAGSTAAELMYKFCNKKEGHKHPERLLLLCGNACKGFPQSAG